MQVIKRVSIFILIVAIAASAAVFIFRARILAYYVPTIEQIGDIHIKVEKDTCYIGSKLTVKNKTFLKIEMDTIKYRVSLFDKTYLKNQKFIGMVLHGHAKDTIDFSLKIPYKSILNDLKVERRKGDSASYSINIYLQYSTFFRKAEMPINKSAKIKIPQPPELEVMEVKYKKIRLKSILADAKVKIVNYSSVSLLIKNMNYSVKILNKGNLKGNYMEPIDIKPNGTTFINLPLEINVNNMGKTIFEVLINKDNYDYALTLNAVLESPDSSKGSFHIDLTKNGKMELKK